MTTPSLPLIGITLNATTLPFAQQHAIPAYTMTKNCVTLTTAAGGVPIAISPCNKKSLSILLEKIDGIILYQETPLPNYLTSLQNYTPFNYYLLQIAWKKNIPLLAISNGAQMMALFLQGQLSTIFSQENTLPHIQLNSPYQGSHNVQIQSNSLLYSLTPRTIWMVNSFHHHRIQSTGQAIVSALAEDGTIEALEDPTRNFFLGVQWHPEFAVDYTDRKLFAAFVAKARTYAQTKS